MQSTTEYTEHTEESVFRVFRVFRGKKILSPFMSKTAMKTPPPRHPWSFTPREAIAIHIWVDTEIELCKLKLKGKAGIQAGRTRNSQVR